MRDNIALPVRLGLGRARGRQGRIAHDARASCLVATHDPEAVRYADRVLHLVDGEFGERGQ